MSSSCQRRTLPSEACAATLLKLLLRATLLVLLHQSSSERSSTCSSTEASEQAWLQASSRTEDRRGLSCWHSSRGEGGMPAALLFCASLCCASGLLCARAEEETRRSEREMRCDDARGSATHHSTAARLEDEAKLAAKKQRLWPTIRCDLSTLAAHHCMTIIATQPLEISFQLY